RNRRAVVRKGERLHVGGVSADGVVMHRSGSASPNDKVPIGTSRLKPAAITRKTDGDHRIFTNRPQTWVRSPNRSSRARRPAAHFVATHPRYLNRPRESGSALCSRSFVTSA